MDIRSIATKNVFTITNDKSLAAAIDLMAEHKIGILLVTAKDKDLTGILSERDIIGALAKHGADALNMNVPACMTAHVFTCSAETHPHDVLTDMQKRNIRHMPVLADDGTLAGVVSSTDIMRYLAKHTSPDEQAMMWAKILATGV